jgi:hypothetical protein
MTDPSGPRTRHAGAWLRAQHLVGDWRRISRAVPPPTTQVGRRSLTVLALIGLIAVTLFAVPSASASRALQRTVSSYVSPQARHLVNGAEQTRQPNDNPANPHCNIPGASPFNGGTGPFTGNQFESNYASEPITGAADVPNGNFTNIFLYLPATPTQTWDQHVKALGAPTSEQIDALTKALVCSSYFDALTQYALNPPTFAGAETTFSVCVQAALKDAASTGGVISFATMRTFAGCEDSMSGNPSTQVNIFVSPDIKASNYGQDGTWMCSPGTDGSSSTGGYHGFGLSVPNWTLIPTGPMCNATPGAVLHSLSHEMVETISDPAGLGWIHGSGPFQFSENYDQGELGDICSGLGNYAVPPVPFPDVAGLTGLTVAAYWSDQDTSCEPHAIMNDVLVPLEGSPSIRFTGSVHNLTVSTSGQPKPPPGVLQELELDIITGGDNLNGGSAANVIVQVNQPGTPTPFVFEDTDINEGTAWNNNTFHAVFLNVPSGIEVSEITSITLNTEFSGGLFGDNWDVEGLEVQAAVYPLSSGECKTTLASLLDVNGTATLSDSHIGLVRFKGGAVQQFSEALKSVPASEQDLAVTALQFQVGTGADDLRGGNEPNDNANAILGLTDGRSVEFSNLNMNNEWPSGVGWDPTIQLLNLNSLPPQTTAAALLSIALETALPGGLSGDNWDVTSMNLTASLGCSATAAPLTKTVTVTNVTGTAVLPDSSKGLCRLTGAVHTCGVATKIPAKLASDQVDALQMAITTGHDNLNGGGLQGDNVTVAVGGLSFPNVNQSDTWDNYSTASFPLAPLPSTPLKLSQLSSITISTDFTGVFPDNWDILTVVLQATVALPSHAALAPALQTENARRAAVTCSSDDRATGGPRCAAGPVPALVPKGRPPWSVTTSPDRGSGDNTLNSVSCPSATKCVAVGFDDAADGEPRALLETWNGSTWSVTSSPSTGSDFSMLSGVSCAINYDYCIAVGVEGSAGPAIGFAGLGGATQTLIEAWRGSGWYIEPSPKPSGTGAALNSVSCPGRTLVCVAAGWTVRAGTGQTLIETSRDEGPFTVTPSPDVGKGDSVLNGVSCANGASCIAVGFDDEKGVSQSLIENWNGTTWSVVPSKNKGLGHNVFDGIGDNVLEAVSCTPGSFCVAVGYYYNAHHVLQSLVTTPLGPNKTWSIPPSANPGANGSILNGISCTTSTDCIAVGAAYNGSATKTLAEDTNGKAWLAVPSPSPGVASNFLTGASCASAAVCEAVGGSGKEAAVNQTLVLAGSPLLPGPPVKVLSVAGDAAATVFFLKPGYHGFSPIVSYTIAATDTTTAANGGQTATGTSSPITVTGLTNGDNYTFTMSATNSAGGGPPSGSSAAVTPRALSWASPKSVDPGHALASVSCASKSFCAAVDGAGNVVMYNGTSWTAPAQIDTGTALTGVTCRSASFCMAVDQAGNALVYNGTSWSAPQAVDAGHSFTSVSCANRAFCAAVDSSGGVLIWHGKAWAARVILDPSSVALNAVSCPVLSFCIAVDNNGNAFNYSGSWAAVPKPVLSGSPLLSVSCPSKIFCTTTDDGTASLYDGTKWSSPTDFDGTNPVVAVTCVARWSCVALDKSGGSLAYNGASWSASAPLGDSPAVPAAVSCFTQAFCVTVDNQGNVTVGAT